MQRPVVGVAAAVGVLAVGAGLAAQWFVGRAHAYERAPVCAGAPRHDCVAMKQAVIDEVHGRTVTYLVVGGGVAVARVGRGAPAVPRQELAQVARWRGDVVRVGKAETDDSPVATEATFVGMLLAVPTLVMAWLLVALETRRRTGSWVRRTRADLGLLRLPVDAAFGGALVWYLWAKEDFTVGREVAWWLGGLGAGGFVGLGLYLWPRRSGRAAGGR